MENLQDSQMSWLPIGTALGSLELKEVLVEYEGPRVITVQNRTGQHYLAEWATESDTFDEWLYVPVSARRLSMVLSGAWNLRRAITEAEGDVWLATLNHDPDLKDSASVASSLEEDWLPSEDFRLEIEVPTQPEAVPASELRDRAAAEGRSRFRLELGGSGMLRTESSTRRLGPTLTKLQGVLDNIGAAEIEDTPPQRGRFSSQVMRQMDTNVIELAAASFVIEIGAADTNDLFNDSPAGRAMEELVGLFSTELSDAALVAKLLDLRPRAAKSFRGLVQELSQQSGSITVATANTARQTVISALTNDQIQDLKLRLNRIAPDDVFELRGRMRLYMADANRNHFGVEDLESNVTFEGNVSLRAIPSLAAATINDNYDVVITEYISLDGATGEQSSKFILEQLSESESDTPVPLTRSQISGLESEVPDS